MTLKSCFYRENRREEKKQDIDKQIDLITSYYNYLDFLRGNKRL